AGVVQYQRRDIDRAGERNSAAVHFVRRLVRFADALCRWNFAEYREYCRKRFEPQLRKNSACPPPKKQRRPCESERVSYESADRRRRNRRTHISGNCRRERTAAAR